jgi:hypothetical protein
MQEKVPFCAFKQTQSENLRNKNTSDSYPILQPAVTKKRGILLTFTFSVV